MPLSFYLKTCNDNARIIPMRGDTPQSSRLHFSPYELADSYTALTLPTIVLSFYVFYVYVYTDLCFCLFFNFIFFQFSTIIIKKL